LRVQISRIKDAVGAQLRKAGSVHPHKLATSFVKLALASTSSSFSYFSWTPVKEIKQVGDKWEADCHAKGTFRAKEVILCTNAHTKHIFPEGSPFADQYVVAFFLLTVGVHLD
jgi:glycine/D-amino acid oxidase-like deaminating enzyme